MKQFNTLNQLRRFAADERLMFHAASQQYKSFRTINPILATGFGTPSDKCLLRYAVIAGLLMGPALKRRAHEAKQTWGA